MKRLAVSVVSLLVLLVAACSTTPSVPTGVVATIQAAPSLIAPALTSAPSLVPTIEAAPSLIPTIEAAPSLLPTVEAIPSLLPSVEPNLTNTPVAAPTVSAGTTPGAAATMPQVTVTGDEYKFNAPDQVDSGFVAITFENIGKLPHQANLARLAPGKTMQDLAAAFQQGLGPALAMLQFVGGPNTIDPGGKQTTIVNLTPGDYVFLCFVPDADGTPHLAKGMIRPIHIVSSTNAVTAEPTTDGSVTLKDFAFDLPSNVSAGSHMWKVTNTGSQPHEMTLVKLADGKSVTDVLNFMKAPSGQPPFTYAGGIAALSPGLTGYVSVNLQSGNYVVMCNVTDVSTGKPHFDEGMITPLTVP